MRKVYTRLTVGELRKSLGKLPDDALVLVDFHTEYDGNEVEYEGTATWAMDVNSPTPNLRIEATAERRVTP